MVGEFAGARERFDNAHGSCASTPTERQDIPLSHDWHASCGRLSQLWRWCPPQFHGFGAGSPPRPGASRAHLRVRRTVGALFGRDSLDGMVTVLPQPDQLTRAQPEEPNADAVQDAYVLAVQAMSRDTAAPREQGRFAPWLLKIVANVALGKLRRRSGSLTSIHDLPQEPPDDRFEQPPSAVERREQRKDVLYALLTLPDAQRAALTLREYQGLNYDEIGDLLGLNRAATATLLYRARTAFREAYEGLVEHAESLSCPDLAPMVSAMLDHELEPDSWAFVQRHLDRCRRCQTDLRQLRRSRRRYRAVPLLLPPAGWSRASTLEAASTAGVVGAARLAMSTGGTAPAVVAPAAAGSTADLPEHTRAARWLRSVASWRASSPARRSRWPWDSPSHRSRVIEGFLTSPGRRQCMLPRLSHRGQRAVRTDYSRAPYRRRTGDS